MQVVREKKTGTELLAEANANVLVELALMDLDLLAHADGRRVGRVVVRGRVGAGVGELDRVLELDGRLELHDLHGVGARVVVEHAIGEVARLVGELEVNASRADDFAVCRVDGSVELERRARQLNQVSNGVNQAC